MSQTKTKSKSWPEIGQLRKGDSGSYIKLNDNVTILVDGQPVDMNDKRIVRLEDPRAKVEALASRGFITEAEADSRLEKLSGMSWLRYSLVISPNKPIKD